jgi:hypothetical protein
MKQKIIYTFFSLAAILFLSGCSNSSENKKTTDPSNVENVSSVSNQSSETNNSWQYGGSSVAGKFADANVLEIENGKYRMYYSAEPEIPGFKGQVYSAISNDGIKWTQELGTRMEWATFPAVIKLSDGKYRIYYQNQNVIKSAISSDGLNWTQEAGTRIDSTNAAGLVLNNVAAPTIIKSDNGYIMVYRGDINQKYPEKVPNPNTELFLWATSSDGLAFEKKGVALDSRNGEFKGLLDGPELVKWDDGSIRLYFWSYKGIYHTDFKDNKFSTASEFDYSTNADPKKEFYENPPSDPTLIKISGKWFMYYGQHAKGIFYAVLK